MSILWWGLLLAAGLAALVWFSSVVDLKHRVERALEKSDSARLDALEQWSSLGVIDVGVELEGGVYITVALVGGPEIRLREQNSVREAIDRLRARSDLS